MLVIINQLSKSVDDLLTTVSLANYGEIIKVGDADSVRALTIQCIDDENHQHAVLFAGGYTKVAASLRSELQHICELRGINFIDAS